MRLVHPGRGRGWWWPGLPVVADDERVWVLRGQTTRGVWFPGVEQVWRDEDGLLATAGARWVRLDTGEVGIGPANVVRVWAADGFLYWGDRGRTVAVDVLRRRERFAAGPRGGVLVGERGFTRGGAPGRSPQPLPRPLLPTPIRWSSDGARVAGLDEDERGVVVDLVTGELEEHEGIPVAVDAWVRGSRIVRRGRVARRGVAEASSARWEHWLAGPGGWVWDLRTGEPVARRPVVALGFTVGTPQGFLTVDWQSGRGWTAPFDDPRKTGRFRLPIDPDDMVVAGVWGDGATYLRTALGDTFRVRGPLVEPGPDEVPDPPGPVWIETALGPFEAAGTWGRYAWNDDGWLVDLGA